MKLMIWALGTGMALCGCRTQPDLPVRREPSPPPIPAPSPKPKPSPHSSRPVKLKASPSPSPSPTPSPSPVTEPSPAPAPTPSPHFPPVTGLKPAQKNEQEIINGLPSNPPIEPNDLALERINSERQAEGLPPLPAPTATPAAFPASTP